VAAQGTQEFDYIAGQEVTLHVLVGSAYGSYFTRVAPRGGEGRSLAVLAPWRVGAPLSIAAGTPVRLTVDQGPMTFHYETFVRGEGSGGRIDLEPPVWSERVQRRASVRVPMSLPVAFSASPSMAEARGRGPWAPPRVGPRPLIGRTRDLSGGGMLLASPAELTAGDVIVAEIDLGGQGKVTVTAECVRVVRQPHGRDAAGCLAAIRFAGNDRRTQERIVAAVFEEQRRRLAAGLVLPATSTAQGVRS
jgi:hypothetical protein